jgi:hypothetical protein
VTYATLYYFSWVALHIDTDPNVSNAWCYRHAAVEKLVSSLVAGVQHHPDWAVVTGLRKGFNPGHL